MANITGKSKITREVAFVSQISYIFDYDKSIIFTLEQLELSQVFLQAQFSDEIKAYFGDSSPVVLPESGVELSHNYSESGIYTIFIYGNVTSIISLYANSAKVSEVEMPALNSLRDLSLRDNVLRGAFNLERLTALEKLDIQGNNISELLAIASAKLSHLLCNNNNMSASVVDNILIELDRTSIEFGTIFIKIGNGMRTLASEYAYDNLLLKGWIIDGLFNMWTVDSTGQTFSMTITGTPGETLGIDWGDGSSDSYIFTGTNQIISHDYSAGEFMQRWNVNKLTITHLITTSQNLVGDLPIAIQGFYNLYTFNIQSNQFTGDLSGWSTALANWGNIDNFQIRSNQFTGDLSGWSTALANWNNISIFYIHINQFTGDLSGWSTALANWNNIYTFYIHTNQFTGDLSGWSTALANCGNITNFQIQSNKFTGVNEIIDHPFFNFRTIFTANTKTINVSMNSDSLMGLYQQPDLGTYAGNLNDLTEEEIDNLAIGKDFDGLGINTAWSILEKVWILKLLEISSLDYAKRYGFIISY